MMIERKGRRLFLDGQVLPWLNEHTLMEYILNLCEIESDVMRKWIVFEWGSGFSTLWWQKHCRVLISIEHTPEWYKFLKDAIAPNCSLKLRKTKKSYVTAINEAGGSYDCIIVDGRWRYGCLVKSLSRVKCGGILIFDNSNCSLYQDCIELLKNLSNYKLEYKSPDHFKKTPTTNWETSIYKRIS